MFDVFPQFGGFNATCFHSPLKVEQPVAASAKAHRASNGGICTVVFIVMNSFIFYNDALSGKKTQ